MKKLISLSLVLSLGLATISPALNAAQTQIMKQGDSKHFALGLAPMTITSLAQAIRQRGSAALPTWTKSPGFEAAKKWWKAGRDMNALSPQEQKAFSALKTKVGITAIVAIITAILVASASLAIKQDSNVNAVTVSNDVKKTLGLNKSKNAFLWYEIFGFKKAPLLNEAKKAYRQLSLKYHPDKTTDENMKPLYTEIQKTLNVAWEKASE